MFPRLLIIAAIGSVLCLSSKGAEPGKLDHASRHWERTEETSKKDAKATQHEEPEQSEEDPEPTTEELLEQVDWSSFDLPISTQEQVLFFGLESYGSTRRWVFHRWMKRSWRYRLMIQRELSNAGLPTDLLYMAMIESI